MYPLHILVSFLTLSLSANLALCRSTCTINLNEEFRPREEPLILNVAGKEILYPTHGSSIQVKGGDKIRVFCGSKNFKNYKDHSEDTVLIQCVTGNRFKTLRSPTGNSDPDSKTPLLQFLSYLLSASDSYQGGYFSCKAPLKSAVRRSGPCSILDKHRNNHLSEFNIGFQVDAYLLPIITVCFNTVLKSVLWSKHMVSPSVQYHMTKVARIRFIQDRDAYGTLKNVEHLYDRNQQVETISKLVNSKALAQKYIQKDGHSLAYFARGHLSPKGDFVYSGEQLATFHYINVAPQWQYFNGGQWEKIESALRNYIVHNGVKVHVTTGTIGITQLEDEKGEDKDIYLYYNQNKGEKLVKVPKLYFKLVQFGNSSSPLNVAIVGVNQPYENHVKMTTNDVICEDVCHRYPWLSSISEQNDQRQSAGYIYCCTFKDFRSYLESAKDSMLEHTTLHDPMTFGEIRDTIELNEDSFGPNQEDVRTLVNTRLHDPVTFGEIRDDIELYEDRFGPNQEDIGDKIELNEDSVGPNQQDVRSLVNSLGKGPE
uniref:DNA/RNA non-specific endonuclease domain-containing protein n=1 Tax=Cacopsylla melanoneura TaxID=428564 RepID=A0A8D9BQJ9_9HEMI